MALMCPKPASTKAVVERRRIEKGVTAGFAGRQLRVPARVTATTTSWSALVAVMSTRGECAPQGTSCHLRQAATIWRQTGHQLCVTSIETGQAIRANAAALRNQGRDEPGLV